MKPSSNERRLVWMALGLVAGLTLASFWPHEVAHAVSTDRDEKFAICTVDAASGLGAGALSAPEAVFVLDFLTGELYGALIDQQSQQFTNFWYRKVVADFQEQADGADKAKYAIIPGRGNLNSRSGQNAAASLIYIGELTSGKIIAYRFQYRNSKTPLPVQPVEPFAYFPFRKATKE